MGKALGAVTTGGLSLAVPAIAGKLGIGMDDEQGAFITPEQRAQKEAQAYYSDYDKNMGAATKGVQDGALTKDLFGQGGLQSQLASEQQNLSSRGYELQPQDHEAYGQAAGDISRQFGQQEQDLSKMLARRGLGGASSGAAGAGFSGLAGNKNEMLAKAQTDIAQKRMADTTQRLQQTRNMMGQLSQYGTQSANDAWSQKGASLLQAGNSENNMNDQSRQVLADQQAAIKPGLFSTIGQGLQAGIGNLATQAPGMAATGATGVPMSSGGQSQVAAPQKKSMFG